MAEDSETRHPRPNFPDSGLPGEFHGNLDAASNFPGDSTWGVPGKFPGIREPRGISREVGCGVRLPEEFPGKSVAPDCGGFP